MSSFATYHCCACHLVVSKISTRIITLRPALCSLFVGSFPLQGKYGRKINQHNMRLPPFFQVTISIPEFQPTKKRYPQLLHRREPIHSGFVSFFFATVFFWESVVLFVCVFQHHKSPSNKMSCGSVGVF